jgi:hypothetical protein
MDARISLERPSSLGYIFLWCISLGVGLTNHPHFGDVAPSRTCVLLPRRELDLFLGLMLLRFGFDCMSSLRIDGSVLLPLP